MVRQFSYNLFKQLLTQLEHNFLISFTDVAFSGFNAVCLTIKYELT